MANQPPKARPTFIIFREDTGEVEELTYSTYAAKRRTQHHNDQVSDEYAPFKWKKRI